MPHRFKTLNGIQDQKELLRQKEQIKNQIGFDDMILREILGVSPKAPYSVMQRRMHCREPHA